MKCNQIYFLLVIVSCLSSFSCGDDDTDIATPQESITTLTYTLTPNNGGDPVTFTYRDLDGDGGDEPVVLGGTLVANLSYVGRVEVLNESVLPAENITEVIDEEGDDHQLFFSYSISGLAVSYADTDDNGNRLGLVSNLRTSSAGNGTLTVTLLHDPDKFAASVANGDLTNAGGQIDIQAMFNITVQ